jgi:hypothetical protein
MASIRGKAPAGAGVRLFRPDGSAPMNATADRRGEFSFAGLADGWYILSLSMPGYREMVKVVHVQGGAEIDFSRRLLSLQGQHATPVLSVCEALDQREALIGQPAVIVGIYKSGMDETLRLDCPFELRSGEIGWPASIGLTHTAQAPDQFRDQIEKKRQEILSSAPPEAPLRPERVVGLYGRFVSLGGLNKAKCCSSPVETAYPPARLFGLNDTDLRVLR